MGLLQHKTPKIIIPLLDGNDVALRGLDLDDFTALLPGHFESVSKIAVLYAAHKESIFSDKSFTDLLLTIAKDFPGIVMEVISIAADEPEARGVKLGAALQVSALAAIMKLTVEQAGGLGNLFGQLQTLGKNVLAAQAELADVRVPSKTSTGNGASK